MIVFVNELDSILVVENDRHIVGTVTLFEDTRLAWLFRFAVSENSKNVTSELYSKAVDILKSKGHNL